jgi:hypothetical protein
MQSKTAMRVCMAATAMTVWFALLLQLYLMIAASLTSGVAVIAVLVNYLSFFTILTNLLVAIGLTFSLCTPTSGWGSFFSDPVVTSGLAVYITMVGVGYSVLLSLVESGRLPKNN